MAGTPDDSGWRRYECIRRLTVRATEGSRLQVVPREEEAEDRVLCRMVSDGCAEVGVRPYAPVSTKPDHLHSTDRTAAVPRPTFEE